MMLYVARYRRVGFTLIEIMIVIAVIAILTLIAIPNYRLARAKSYLETCKKNVQTIGTALETCLIRHSDMEMVWIAGGGQRKNWGSYYESCSQQQWFSYFHNSGMNYCYDGEGCVLAYLAEQGYLGSIPTCPVNQPYTYVSTSGSYNYASYEIDYNFYYTWGGDEWGKNRWSVQCVDYHSGFPRGGKGARGTKVSERGKTYRQPIYILGVGLFDNWN